jgi:hypothetical protein
MRAILIVFIIAGLHWFANVGLLLLEMDTAGFLGLFPERGHGLVAGVLAVIEFPVLHVLRVVAPAKDSWYLPVMILNSVLWGVVLYKLYRVVCVRGRN